MKSNKYDVEKQHALFDELVRQKYRIQYLAGIVQNNWNDFPVTAREFSEWAGEFDEFLAKMRTMKMVVLEFYNEVNVDGN